MNGFINCTKEQELFKEILGFEAEIRLVTVRDGEGRGKSTLLKRLEELCSLERYPPIPVCYLNLKDIPNPDRFDFVERVRNTLAGFEPLVAAFPHFDRLNSARLNGDFHAFIPSSTARATAAGSVQAANAQISGGAVAGSIDTVIQSSGTTNVHLAAPPKLTDEQDQIAKDQCIRAFIEDLKRSGDAQTIVLLLDEWDQGQAELTKWLHHGFVLPLCCDPSRRPEKLVMAMAGRNLPDYKTILQQDYAKRVRPIEPLSPWSVEHVREFARSIYPEIKEQEIEVIGKKIIEDRISLAAIKAILDIYRQVKF